MGIDEAHERVIADLRTRSLRYRTAWGATRRARRLNRMNGDHGRAFTTLRTNARRGHRGRWLVID